MALFRLGLVWILEGEIGRYDPMEDWFEEVGLEGWWKRFVVEEGERRKREREEEESGPLR